MNPLDYASLEASQRLAEAGIALETEASWYLNGAGWQLCSTDWATNMISNIYERIPAPSMSELIDLLIFVRSQEGEVKETQRLNILRHGSCTEIWKRNS